MTENTTGITAGSPIWIDYTAGDFARQQEFYSALFGWTFEDQGEEYGHYQMIRKGDATVGGAMDADLMAQQMGGDVQPAAWSVYLTTEDIQKTMDLVQENGGTVAVPPMAVGPLGHMAVVMSAGGEAVGFWQPGEFGGTTGYATDFGGERSTAGLCDAQQWLPAGMPSYWRVYFQVPDMDAALQVIEAEGGRVIDGPQDSPFGRVASVLDPAGATFQLNQPCGGWDGQDEDAEG